MTALKAILPPRAAPTLRTARLVLRAPTRDDWPAYRDHVMSDRMSFSDAAPSEMAAWGRFAAEIAGWSLCGAGGLAIVHADGLAGFVSLRDVPAYPELQLGNHLLPGFAGRGIAVEAAVALRDWTRAELNPPSLVSYVDPRNAAARGNMARLGAVEDPDAPRSDRPGDLVYRHWGPTPLQGRAARDGEVVA